MLAKPVNIKADGSRRWKLMRSRTAHEDVWHLWKRWDAEVTDASALMASMTSTHTKRVRTFTCPKKQTVTWSSERNPRKYCAAQVELWITDLKARDSDQMTFSFLLVCPPSSARWVWWKLGRGELKPLTLASQLFKPSDCEWFRSVIVHLSVTF